jgi:hypothetical protein
MIAQSIINNRYGFWKIIRIIVYDFPFLTLLPAVTKVSSF